MRTYYMLQNILLAGCLISLAAITGCKKFVDIDPPKTQITDPSVFTHNSSAGAAMNAVYINMVSESQNIVGGVYSIGYISGLSSDELKYYSVNFPIFAQYYTNSLDASKDNYFWVQIFNKIYLCNTIIEGLNKYEGVSAKLKQQLVGEAEFTRAFLNFYLVNFFGDAPLVTSTNYQVNNSISRSSKNDIYAQIKLDLTDAISKLGDGFFDSQGNPSSERTRPNKGAAQALLARVELYLGDWQDAIAQSTAVINNPNYMLNDSLNDVFLANSTEAIWQLQPVEPGMNTYDGYYYVLITTPGNGRWLSALSDQLLGAFEPDDRRYTHWVGVYNDPNDGTNYYYPFKYKIFIQDASQPVTEYNMVLRLAEQYLIRAEAEAQLGSMNDATNDLNIIRTRAGLPGTTASDVASLVAAIQHERQVELFTEWGHRWLDLKRTGQVDAVMSVVTPMKGGSWSPDWALYPVPANEIQANHNLTQNPGYN